MRETAAMPSWIHPQQQAIQFLLLTFILIIIEILWIHIRMTTPLVKIPAGYMQAPPPPPLER